MKWLRHRLSEPSTWGGVGVALIGLGQAFKVNELAPLGEAVAGAGQAAAMGDWVSVAGGLLGGAMAAFMRDKGRQD